MVDYARFIIQKAIFEKIIDLDAKIVMSAVKMINLDVKMGMSTVKIMVSLISEINDNGMHKEMALIEKDITVLYRLL